MTHRCIHRGPQQAALLTLLLASACGASASHYQAGESSTFAAPVAEATEALPASGTTVTVVPAPRRMPAASAVQQQPVAGSLTAATVGDADRRDNYLRYLSRRGAEYQRVGLDMTRRLRVQVVDRNRHPVLGARITVQGAGMEVNGLTHADGVWDFYPSVDQPRHHGPVRIKMDTGNEMAWTDASLPTHGDAGHVVFQLTRGVATSAGQLDLGFAIDVTGSMEDELRYVNAEIGAIVQRVQQAVPNTRVRVGAVLYRDRSDQVPLAQIPFTTDVSGFARHLSQVHASGGGDYPEDLNSGLRAALNDLDWNSDPEVIRVLTLIADAPPQAYQQQYDYHNAMRETRERGIRLLPVAASGADRTVEYLFRALGAYTSTPYVYLTDHSGIGNPHMDADTDRVGVERFAELLARLFIDDLRGHGMHEPGTLGPTLAGTPLTAPPLVGSLARGGQ